MHPRCKSSSAPVEVDEGVNDNNNNSNNNDNNDNNNRQSDIVKVCWVRVEGKESVSVRGENEGVLGVRCEGRMIVYVIGYGGRCHEGEGSV